MNLLLAQKTLSASLGDPTNQVYSLEAINSALLESVRVYGQYEKCLRRITLANLLTPVKATPVTSKLSVVGGPFTIGETMLLDYASPNVELVTISAISADDDNLTICPTGYTTLTLAAPIVNNHPTGAILYPAPAENGQSNVGILTVIGQDTYLLPQDFIEIHQSTFDQAVGIKTWIRKQDSYYDASQSLSNQLSGTGFGRSATFGPGGGQYPLVGSIWNNPNAGIQGPGAVVEYQFFTSVTPMFQLFPIPTFAAMLDFYYYGAQVLSLINGEAGEVINLYAKYVALVSRAVGFAEVSNLGAPGDLKIETYTQTPSKNSEQYLAQAANTYKLWEDKVRFQPYGVSG